MSKKIVPETPEEKKKPLPKALRVQAGADPVAASKWWEKEAEEAEDGEEVKWHYLEHHGVQFPAEYQCQNIKAVYDGKELELSPIQEEIAFYWAQTIGSEWEQKEEFRNNFAKLFIDSFAAKKPMQFEKFDFKHFVDWIANRKEEKKLEQQDKKKLTQEQKEQLKRDKELKDATFGYALLDDYKEKVGGYTIEPPTLFRGRGKHPKSGYFKPRTFPEDVTLNIAEDAPVPKCNWPGRSWKDIMHNPKVSWLAFYRDETINNHFKYFFLSANSRLKGLNDMKKYEKARKLKDKIGSVRADYMQKIASSNLYDKQLGTVTYFIDKLALRVGNEKNDEEEADTVGCCSLRCEHIELLAGNQVKFDFLGKDSMRYENTVTVDSAVYQNLQTFKKGKKPDENLFEHANPSKLNEYLSNMMESLTAKVFRTFNASFTLDRELNVGLDQELCVEDKYKFYNEANKKVAILCNHQKTVNKDFDTRVEKNEAKIREMEAYVTELREHLALVSKGRSGVDAEKVPEFTLLKMKKKFPVSIESTRDSIDKMNARVKIEKDKLGEKLDTKNISLGTSKINYNDPRISVSWCKRHSVPIEKIFSKELRNKFTWAMAVEPSWRF